MEKCQAVPCEGLQEIRITSAKLEGRMNHVEQWEKQQNGSLKELSASVRQLVDLNHEARIERFNQISAVNKTISDSHDATVSLVNANYKQIEAKVEARQIEFTRTMIAAISVTSAIIAAVTAVVIKLMGGP